MKYLKIAEHYKNCFLEHGDTHLGVDWPKYEDTLTRHKIMYDLLKSKEINHVTNSTLLDFGCGLGHFLKWGTDNNSFFPKYSGLDINFEFIEKCKEKFPNVDFYNKDILIDDQIPNFDYIICNGTFTEKLSLSNEEMMTMEKVIEHAAQAVEAFIETSRFDHVMNEYNGEVN